MGIPRGRNGYRVDLPPYESFAKQPEKMWRELLRMWPEKDFHMVFGDSHSDATEARLHEALAGRKIDFAFIDGDHSERDVEQDWKLILPLMAPSGIVASHDILPHNNGASEVDRFWRRQAPGRKTIEYVSYSKQGWAGIGVVFPGGSGDARS